MDVLQHLAIGFALSFVGFIPIGIISLSIVQASVKHGLRAGILIGLGASIVDFFQAFISLKGSHWFLTDGMVSQYMTSIAIVIFLILGLYYLNKSRWPEITLIRSSKQKIKSNFFRRGLGISMLNVLAYPYYVFWGTYLYTEGYLTPGIGYLLWFCLGAMIGAFIMLAIYARLGVLIRDKLPIYSKRADQFVGIVFILLAAIQIVRQAV